MERENIRVLPFSLKEWNGVNAYDCKRKKEEGVF